MRTLSAAALAAVDAIITAPGHLVELGLDTPGPARWSDIGQVVLSDSRVFSGVDMRVQGVGFNGDAAPGNFTIQIANLDSSIGALLLANDVASAPVTVWGFDRAALDVADIAPLGVFAVTQVRIGIDSAALTCAPIFYTAPFRRVDAANGFTHATPEGTKISWGSDQIIFEQR